MSTILSTINILINQIVYCAFVSLILAGISYFLIKQFSFYNVVFFKCLIYNALIFSILNIFVVLFSGGQKNEKSSDSGI
jgi:hypothetical protein